MKIIHTPIKRKSHLNLKEAITFDLEKAQPDFEKEFILTTDALEKEIGAILSLPDKTGKLRMISAYLKALEQAQKNYSTADK